MWRTARRCSRAASGCSSRCVLLVRLPWDEAQIVVESVTTGERVVLIQGGRDARYVPTGHLVYVLNGVLLAVGFDLGARQVIGGSVPLVEGVGYSTISANSGAAHCSLADNGSLVYVPGAAGSGALVSLVWVSRTGQEEAIVAPPRGYRRPRVSPDGTRVAVEILEEASTDVWIWDLAHERLIRLTFDEEGDAYPMWTPDGSRVVFLALLKFVWVTVPTGPGVDEAGCWCSRA